MVEKKSKDYLKQEAAIGLEYGGVIVAKLAHYYKIKWIVRGIFVWMLTKWIILRWVING